VLLSARTRKRGFEKLIRELVSCLDAWDAGSGSGVRLETGLLVSVHRIRREPFAGTGVDPYLTEFECEGRLCTCPLYEFQARTQIVNLESGHPVVEETAPASLAHVGAALGTVAVG